MGQVRIEIAGSFKDAGTVVFSAEEGGHAFALQRALWFLVGKLPSAIRQDHESHTVGSFPPASSFGRLPQSQAKHVPLGDESGR